MKKRGILGDFCGGISDGRLSTKMTAIIRNNKKKCFKEFLAWEPM